MSTASGDRSVLIERRGPDGRLGVLTLNRPRSLNALTHAMVCILARVLREWAQDAGVEAVLLRGAGDRGLCAGGDIVSIYRDATTGGTGSEDFWRDEYALNALIANYPKPYIALMDGIVLGGGVGVSAHGSHRIVTERTKIGMPETGIGFVPDVGGTWLLAHAPGELGTYVALTAAHVHAGDAIELGLADHYSPSTELPQLIEFLAERPVAEALALATAPHPESSLAKQRNWIDAAFCGPDVAGILAALGDRSEPEAETARDAIHANSPTALAVALKALREARHMETLEQALQQEYRIALRMLRGHDFPEGIRARVIDKDNAPGWKPASLGELDANTVDAYFTTLGEADLNLKPMTYPSKAQPTSRTADLQDGTT